MEKTRGGYVISDDKRRLKVPAVMALLEQSYWAKDHSAEKVQKMVANSFCLGLFEGETLVGFARVVTDKATFAWITDFIVDERYRGKDLGTWLMDCLLEHPDLADTSKGLGTQNAEEFFIKFGFTRSSHVLTM
ncbi:MAG TPA: GNAT family N-acetyltransferase [Verrucomicrobiae bacterium]|nr:GNAT family N-acetyltransferase [Verrucomicrobiae bacterium]